MDVRTKLWLYIDAVFEDFLLEEPRVWWNFYREVFLDSILTGEDLPVVWFDVYEAFSAGSFSAASGV
jgi:hypothetical protein